MTYAKSFFGQVYRRGIPSVTLAALAFLAESQTASAIQWTYTLNSSPTNNSTAVDFLSSSDTTYPGTFNILTDGFNPNEHIITSAIARFAFADDGDSVTEYATIRLGSPLTTFIGSTEIDGNHTAPPNSYHWLSASLNSTFLADLQADGLLNFQVRRVSGDFYVKRVVLEVQGESKRVPDAGASIALLGMGLIGLGVFARRRTIA